MSVWFSVAIQASIVLLVFAIGLRTSWRDAVFLFWQPALLLKSLLARNVLLPFIAILLVKAFPLHEAVRGAIVLLSVTPVPPILPNSLVKAGARPPYAAGLLVSHSLFSIVLVPVTVEILNLAFRSQAHFGPLPVAKIILLTIVLPLSAGIFVRHVRHGSSAKLASWIGRVGTALLLLALLPVLVLAWRALLVVLGNGALLALALFVLAGLAAGHALGGPNPGDRTALALATASRHPGIAIAIANANFANQAKLVAGTVIIYMLLCLLLSVAYKHWRSKAPDDMGAAAVPVDLEN